MAPRQRRIRFRALDIVDESAGARTLILEALSNESEIEYAAGQFLTLDLPVSPDRMISRSYSLSSCPVGDPYPAVTPTTTSADVRCSRTSSIVELRGFEPLTSSMPWRRATNCAIAP